MTGRKRGRSRSSWTEARIRRELDEFLAGATEWPSYRDFQRSGYQELRDQVTRHGGARRWAKRLKLPYPERKPGYAKRWTEERVRAELAEFLPGRPFWPSRLEFEVAGHKPLRDAVGRLGGPERWATEFDLPLLTLKSGSKRVWTPERIDQELRKLLDGRKIWPRGVDFEQEAVFGLVSAIRTHGGTVYWARRIGVEPPPQAGRRNPRLWTDERILAELRSFCRGRTTWPTEREFLAAGQSALYNAACRYRGPRYWATELGLVRRRRHGPTRGA